MTLEGTLLYSREHAQDVSPKQVLETAVHELGLTEKDLIHVAARYLNNYSEYRNKECGTKIKTLDLKKYSADNFDQMKWDKYVSEMVYQGLEKKLEFQTIMQAIKSEDLLREYYYNKKIGEKKKDVAEHIKKTYNHGQLAVALASDIDSIDTPVSICFRIIDLGLGNYTNSLNRKAEDKKNTETVISDLLDNLSGYFYLLQD